ncbi:GlsB/YeaQ/YmgE family stress response membrane protein [Microvirga sp. BT688]|uniref:GlsB/YeaQ/YmgE family stress response membrane protein n=1 Tax=Microvirga sp. TaxID=1873136 RepID=UPI001684A837|nr:GlsB/YeaQ/YmgE family stress response membrane protein [Microvirga sp.]MBD2750767.1 GlsB/YeaQ/YmgE family stress response membrane protein [Microvirga sp.]
MSIMWIVALGSVAGVIARLVTPGRKGPFGFVLTGLLGIIGAVAASYLGQEAGWYQAEDSTGLIAAVFGAVILLLIWGVLFRSRRPTSSI